MTGENPITERDLRELVEDRASGQPHSKETPELTNISPRMQELQLSTFDKKNVKIKRGVPVVIGRAHQEQVNTLKRHKIKDTILPEGIFITPPNSEKYPKVSRAALVIVPGGEGLVCNIGSLDIIQLFHNGRGTEVFRHTLLGKDSLARINKERVGNGKSYFTDDEVIALTTGNLYQDGLNYSVIVLPAEGNEQTPIIKSGDRDRDLLECTLHFQSKDANTNPHKYYGDPPTYISYYEQVRDMVATNI